MLTFGVGILLFVGWLIAGFARDLTSRVRNLEQDMSVLASGDFSADQSHAAASMAAAMEQLTVSVGQMSDNAQEARIQTEASGKASVAGSKVIHDTMQIMQTIAATVREASISVVSLGNNAKAISSIVDVVRGMAKQTNLLALNAAIEAARAGESGRPLEQALLSNR